MAGNKPNVDICCNDFLSSVRKQAKDFSFDEDLILKLLQAASFTSHRMSNLWDDADECVAKVCGPSHVCALAVRSLWHTSEAFNDWSVTG